MLLSHRNRRSPGLRPTPVEEELGVDLDNTLFEAYDQEPYIEATTIDTTVPADQ